MNRCIEPGCPNRAVKYQAVCAEHSRARQGVERPGIYWPTEAAWMLDTSDQKEAANGV